MKERKYVLASASPRRIEILKSHGLAPLVIPANVEETLPVVGGMKEITSFLAFKKAKAVEKANLAGVGSEAATAVSSPKSGNAASGASDVSGGRTGISLAGDSAADKSASVAACIEPGSLIIAADTIVYKDGRVMGKPRDRADALAMLLELAGDKHFVVTGVAVVEAGEERAAVFADVTAVYFKKYGKEDLLQYLDTDEPYDKAGAYAIQGWFSRYVDKIEGNYDNVVGLPWEPLAQELKRF